MLFRYHIFCCSDCKQYGRKNSKGRNIMIRNENSLSVASCVEYGSQLCCIKKMSTVLMLGIMLTAACMLGISCSQSNGSQPSTIVPTTPTTPKTPETTTPEHNPIYGDEPYDADLANGFNVHNFIGENTRFTTKEQADYYLGDKGMDNIKNRVQRWYQGMNDDSKLYYTNFYDAIMNMQYDTTNPGMSLDNMIDTIGDAATPYVEDVVENLDDIYEGYAYQVCWDVHFGEGYKEALGIFRNCSAMGAYSDPNNGIKNFAIGLSEANTYFADHNVNLAQEYADNNFAGIFQLNRNMLDKVARRIGGVETDDMVEFQDICAFTGSLGATHEHLEGQLHATHNCETSFGNQIESTLIRKFNEINRRNRANANNQNMINDHSI